MTTGTDWLNTTRSYLMSGYTENRNQLAQAYTAGGTTLTFKHALNGITNAAN